jgi:hypothetical protein
LIPFIQKIILTSYAIEIIILWLYHIPGMDVANQEHDRRLKILNSINCIGEKVNAEDILDEFSCIIDDIVPGRNAAAIPLFIPTLKIKFFR